MESTRKQFLAAAGLVGASLLAPTSVEAQASSPSPAPSATPAPSPAAQAFAQRMKSYDASLSDAQIDEIAANVDQLFGLGKDLRPKGHQLVNGDPPTPQFEVGA
ncbi:MAG: hypothetical protein KGN02_02515 [bacterium]|nr:hypothetical protein [bacterium]